MARVIANKSADHVLTINADTKPGDEIILIRGGRRAYLWIGGEDGRVIHASGPKTLRALAEAILREVPND
jgi:hypothetical protein